MPADQAVESRLLLGTLLRRARADARVATADAAKAISGSSSKISRLESGQVPARTRDVETLIRLYKVPPAGHADLLRLADEAAGPSWWEQDAVDGTSADQVREDLLLEPAAELICMYDPQCFPSLLQSPAYLKALYPDPGNPGRTGLDIRTLWRRTQLMNAAGAPRVWAIFGASVLKRAPNDNRAALREQARHLAILVNRGALAVQFLADNSSAHMIVPGQFEILRFRPADLADVVLVELLAKIRTERDLRASEAYRQAFARLTVAACTPERSREMLAAAARAD